MERLQRQPRPAGLRRLGVLRHRFDPVEGCGLQDLARLLDPSCPSRSFRARTVGVGDGTWILESPAREWMIKKVSIERIGSNLPTQLENCDALVQKFPGIVRDKKLAFPHSVIELQGHTGERVGDLLVSRRAPGVQLGRFLADLDLRKAQDQLRLERVCAGVGEMLADFHARYADPKTGEATYHTDFHPSNVLYEQQTDTLSIVDLTGMGTPGVTDDLDKFQRLLARLAGERYATAFRLRYIALAPAWVSERSSTKSTAASSDKLLYPPTAETFTTLPRATSFRSLSSLATGFDPHQNITTLAWLVSPKVKLVHPRLQPARTKAWMLYQSGQKECFYLQYAPAKSEAPGLPSIAERCEEFVGRYPWILDDLAVAFPHCVIPLQMSLKYHGAVFVANCGCNSTLEQYALSVRESRDADEEEKLLRICFKAGEDLCHLQQTYDVQEPHLQLRPSCVLYDRDTGLIAFADFAWAGDDAVSAKDRLTESVRSFAGQAAAEEFRRGYSCRQRSSRSRENDVCLLPWSCRNEPVSEAAEDASSSESEDEAGLSCCLM
ncbi:unnamed protein product [Effrenium voratum]|uniref:Uncharacterized protein n=1 Tax=Effrenium voratum TaxID=2562239 RepID=A0AA36I9E0_9DINO|nr:unnamed protein product [Effrenium voratum]CAJ1383152.1 unnamed protein product [Effrenium voratum]